jgi:pimeloyl-ACP methyl ester carboxylesterase
MTGPTSDGGDLAFESRGAGPAVVLLHGLTFDRSMWRPVLDRVSRVSRCVAVDLPGHGDSREPSRRLDEVATSIHRLLENLDVERPVVVGHSMAAVVAILYAARYPVGGIVLVDQPLEMAPFAHLVQRLAPALRSETFAAAFEPFRASMGIELVPEPYHSQLNRSQRIERDLVLSYWDQALTTAPTNLQSTLDDALAAITAPCLAIFGRALERSEIAQWQSNWPAIKVEQWPGYGHLPHLVDADRFAHRLVSFIAECTAARTSHP